MSMSAGIEVYDKNTIFTAEVELKIDTDSASGFMCFYMTE